jgi:hypothetical protein
MSTLAAGLAVAASCLTACAVASSSPTHHTANSDPAPPSTGHADPLSLVGRWSVKAAGEPADSTLILGDQLTVFEACGALSGEWRAGDDGAFISYVDSGDGACFRQTHTLSVPWLSHVTSYRVQGSSRLLLDASGKVVARLAPGGRPKVSRHDDPSEADAPKLSHALRSTLAPSPPAPASLHPATKATLVGQWRALGPQRGSPKGYVRFEPGREWHGSDGCNGSRGQYDLDGSGRLIITPGGINGAVGCVTSPAPQWAEQARFAGFDSRGQLVLVDVHGTVLGHLARTDTR